MPSNTVYVCVVLFGRETLRIARVMGVAVRVGVDVLVGVTVGVRVGVAVGVSVGV